MLPPHTVPKVETAVDSIFDYIDRSAEEVPEGVRWQTFTHRDEPQYGTTVYNGVSGITFFLSEYARLRATVPAIWLGAGWPGAMRSRFFGATSRTLRTAASAWAGWPGWHTVARRATGLASKARHVSEIESPATYSVPTPVSSRGTPARASSSFDSASRRTSHGMSKGH